MTEFEWHRNVFQITNGRSLKKGLIILEFSNEYKHLFFSNVCTELAFSSLTWSAKRALVKVNSMGKGGGGGEYWETSAGKTLPLSPPLVFGSSPVPISPPPLGIANDIACHL